MYTPREMSLNTQMQTFASNMVQVLSGDYSKTLGMMYETLFADNRSRTGANHYVMGDKVFFEYQQMRPVTQVKFGINGSRALSKDLQNAHYVWFNEYSDFILDRAKIEQTIKSIVMRATSWQDFRDMFPDHIIRDFIPRHNALAVLNRTRPDLDVGPKHSPNYQQNLIDRHEWPVGLLDMYTKIGGTLSMYVGYKYL